MQPGDKAIPENYWKYLQAKEESLSSKQAQLQVSIVFWHKYQIDFREIQNPS